MKRGSGLGDEFTVVTIRVLDKNGFHDDYEIEVVPISPTTMQIRETVITEQFSFGDTIEVEPRGGAYLFRRVAEPSRFRSFEYVLAKGVAETKAFQRLLDRVVQLGGYWERIMDGWLLIHLPDGSEYDPTDDIRALKGEAD